MVVGAIDMYLNVVNLNDANEEYDYNEIFSILDSAIYMLLTIVLVVCTI